MHQVTVLLTSVSLLAALQGYAQAASPLGTKGPSSWATAEPGRVARIISTHDCHVTLQGGLPPKSFPATAAYVVYAKSGKQRTLEPLAILVPSATANPQDPEVEPLTNAYPRGSYPLTFRVVGGSVLATPQGSVKANCRRLLGMTATLEHGRSGSPHRAATANDGEQDWADSSALVASSENHGPSPGVRAPSDDADEQGEPAEHLTPPVTPAIRRESGPSDPSSETMLNRERDGDSEDENLPAASGNKETVPSQTTRTPQSPRTSDTEPKPYLGVDSLQGGHPSPTGFFWPPSTNWRTLELSLGFSALSSTTEGLLVDSNSRFETLLLGPSMGLTWFPFGDSTRVFADRPDTDHSSWSGSPFLFYGLSSLESVGVKAIDSASGKAGRVDTSLRAERAGLGYRFSYLDDLLFTEVVLVPWNNTKTRHQLRLRASSKDIPQSPRDLEISCVSLGWRQGLRLSLRSALVMGLEGCLYDDSSTPPVRNAAITNSRSRFKETQHFSVMLGASLGLPRMLGLAFEPSVVLGRWRGALTLDDGQTIDTQTLDIAAHLAVALSL